MYLRSLWLYFFKNYDEASINFGSGINVFLGNNGAGKTNLLDAIHYLCLTKSAFHSSDSYTVKRNESFFSSIGVFYKNSSDYKIICGLKEEKKILTCNGVPYSKINEHIGKFPCVMIAPDQIEIIKGGSEERRKFIDNVISQIDAVYLEQLIVYNKYLKARNALLKQFVELNYRDLTLLESYTSVLIQAGNYISQKRKEFITQFSSIVINAYNELSGTVEQTHINHETDYIDSGWASIFDNSLADDFRACRTTKGLHQDDYVFSINGLLLRKFGSQGQQKTFLLALKLAQHRIIESFTLLKPILLLDDIFDKLDDHRINHLLNLCKNGEFGQVFITDARRDRTEALFREKNIHAQIFEIKNNIISTVS